MEHQYLLTLFLADDDSFYNYISKKSDEEAIQDINAIKTYMDFMLTTLIRSKEKLENIGCSYEPLSESFKALIKVKEDGTMFRAYHTPLTYSSEPRLNKSYLSDLAISIIRLSKNDPYETPKTTKYINPKYNVYIKNLVATLK